MTSKAATYGSIDDAEPTGSSSLASSVTVPLLSMDHHHHQQQQHGRILSDGTRPQRTGTTAAVASSAKTPPRPRRPISSFSIGGSGGRRPVLKTITSRRSVYTTTKQQQQPPPRYSNNESAAGGLMESVTEEGEQEVQGGSGGAGAGRRHSNYHDLYSQQQQETSSSWIGPRTKEHSFVYTMLNPRSDAWQATIFKWFITIVILLDLLAFILSTDPKLSSLNEQQQQSGQMDIFGIWEATDSWIFLIEYILRVITVVESNKYGSMGPIMGRLRWMVTTPAIIDLCATLPYFVEKSTRFNLPTLTYLRSLRLLRILKTSGFSEATKSVCRVFYYNAEILYVAAMIGMGLVLFTAVLMYYLRPRDQDHPEFRSIPKTLYLSTLMLTGQGGPDGEIPWYTSAVVLLTGVFSIGMFAIPASMLTWGFEAEAERYAKLARRRKEKQQQAEAAAAGDETAQAIMNQEHADEIEHDNWSYSSDDYSTDEEYQKIIAGEDGDDDEEDEEARIRRQFELADIDGSGNISLSEFLKLSRNLQANAQATGGSNNPVDDKPDNLAKIAPAFAARLTQLEQRQHELSVKLDRVLQLLESSQPKS